jgi:hypothetical protein
MSINSIKRDISSWVNSIGQGEVTEPFFDFIQSMGEAKAKQVAAVQIVSSSHLVGCRDDHSSADYEVEGNPEEG